MVNKIYGNEISFRTFDSSNVNQVELNLPDLTIEEKEEKEFKVSSNYGFSNELREINTKRYNHYKEIVAKENESINESIEYVFDERLIELTDIKACKNSNVNITLNYNDKTKSDFRSSLIRLIIEENATVNLFIVQTEDNKKSIESIVADIKENATLNLFQYELGNVELYSNLKANLVGEESNLNVNSIYFGFGMNELNMLYDIFHIGEKSNSDVIVNGALRDNSYKNFKSTLDFKKGSRGSLGSEEEYTVLLSDEAVSLSVPVLLAHEDDIQGNHAASAGKIDSELLFYLTSRGLDEQQAESLIVLSKFATAIDAIENEDLRNSLNERVQEIVRR